MIRCCPQAWRILFAALPAASLAIPAHAATPQIPPATVQIAETTQPPLSPELRGDLAMAHQQYVAAIQAYREVPRQSPIIFNKIGMAYHHLFAMDEARRNYQIALHMRPDYAEALNNLGAVYYARKQYRKAEKYYRKAIALEPQSAPIYSNLGTDYFAEHKLDRGIQSYRTAFALDPEVFQGSSLQLVSESLPARARAEQDYCLARLFAQSGHKNEALDYLRKALNEGFDDKKKLLQDQTLASLRSMPEFAQLMNEEKLR
jgi:tetratricopeptide (TPR) repeat protein